MYTYHCLNNISDTGLSIFGDNYSQVDTADADAILVRSANMKEMESPSSVQTIARAGAGVNNIPLDKCAERGIVVFNTPGANANGVKELVIAGMLLASRDVVGGINWVKSQEDLIDIGKRAEKEKKKFAGSEISGKKLGIIGLGAIGVLVANAAVGLGMEVYGYDPFLSLKSAWNVSRAIKHIKDINEIYSECDYITIHVPATDNTKGMIGADEIEKMKDGVVVLNFARDVLVDEKAMIDALESGKVSKYVTDFATPGIVNVKNTIVIPHLGASTDESEENCARMAVEEVIDFLENGNIHNSVNYPNCDHGKCTTAARITVCHRNLPGKIAQFTSIIGELNINIADITSKSRGDYAYCIIDIETDPTDEIKSALESIDGVTKVRIIK